MENLKKKKKIIVNNPIYGMLIKIARMDGCNIRRSWWRHKAAYSEATKEKNNSGRRQHHPRVAY
jgi:hypothetical protein